MTPFVVFTIAFIIALILSISNPFVFAVIGFIFAMHVGGCAGDLYVFFLLTFKYKFGANPAAMKQAGIAYATDQIIDLFANGIKNVHVYTMNKPDVAKKILENLSEILG